MSSAFSAYDGVPLWLIDRLPPAKHKYPWPFGQKIPQEQWAMGYFTEAVNVAFQQLYDNVSGARDAMAEFWTKIASVFSDSGNILGYEVGETDNFRAYLLTSAKTNALNLYLVCCFYAEFSPAS